MTAGDGAEHGDQAQRQQDAVQPFDEAKRGPAPLPSGALATAAAAWSSAFGLFVLFYGPLLLSPRRI